MEKRVRDTNRRDLLARRRRRRRRKREGWAKQIKFCPNRPTYSLQTVTALFALFSSGHPLFTLFSSTSVLPYFSLHNETQAVLNGHTSLINYLC